MLLRPGNSNPILSLILCVLLIFAFSCSSKEEYAGTYQEVKAQASQQSKTIIELNESGIGKWITLEDEVSFAWYLKGGELRFNTKEGGVIVGKIKNGTFEIKLPGREKMIFKKGQ